MMTGTVTSGREAILEITVRDGNSVDHTIRAVVDSGYTGFLSLPPSVIASLGLRIRGIGRGRLADDTPIQFDIHEGVVMWDGRPRTIRIASLDGGPLIGMS